MPSSFQLHCHPEHPFYQRWANDPFLSSRSTVHSIVKISSGEVDQEDAVCWPANYALSCRNGSLPRCTARAFVSYLREQGFRTAWKDDPREVHFLYANSYYAAAAQLLINGLKRTMLQALYTTSFALLQGVMAQMITT